MVDLYEDDDGVFRLGNKGTFVINGVDRVVVSQLHRAAGVIFSLSKKIKDFRGKSCHIARLIPGRGSWLDFEFDPKDCLFVRIDRRRKLPATILLRAIGYSNEEILNLFFDTNVFHIKADTFILVLDPKRLRGELAVVDIKDKAGKVIVAKGHRVSQRQVSQIATAGIKQPVF